MSDAVCGTRCTIADKDWDSLCRTNAPVLQAIAQKLGISVEGSISKKSLADAICQALKVASGNLDIGSNKAMARASPGDPVVIGVGDKDEAVGGVAGTGFGDKGEAGGASGTGVGDKGEAGSASGAEAGDKDKAGSASGAEGSQYRHSAQPTCYASQFNQARDGEKGRVDVVPAGASSLKEIYKLIDQFIGDNSLYFAIAMNIALRSISVIPMQVNAAGDPMEVDAAGDMEEGGDDSDDDDEGDDDHGGSGGEGGGYSGEQDFYDIFVRMPSGRTVTLTVEASDTIDTVKALFRSRQGWPKSQQRLLFAGGQLEDDPTLYGYGIFDNTTLRLVARARGGGKRARGGDGAAGVVPEVSSKALKVAALKVDLDASLNKEVADELALVFMGKAQALANEGPLTAAALCDTLAPQDITLIQKFVDEDTERNGPVFYGRLLAYFVPEFVAFLQHHNDVAAAKVAIERAWSFRMHMLFMSPGGVMTRDGIKDALDARKKQLRDIASREQNEQQVRQRLNDALQNPQVLGALVADPNIQAVLMAALQQQQQQPQAANANAQFQL